MNQAQHPEEFAEETIAAIATPAGRGGLGIVRLSGTHAFALARILFPALALEHARAHLAHFRDQAGDVLDEVMVTAFHRPRSYTSEDVVEIAAHGSPVLLAALLDALLARGARLAEPGEFTRRAFLNGRIDLTQAEAVRDLIDAQTLYQARVAARQLSGSLARRLAPVKSGLKELIAMLEAGIDFADNDVSFLSGEQIDAKLARLTDELAPLLASLHRGRVVREGATLAILGRPNVGKSSLFNRLLESERAIVTHHAGTTRDLVSETFSLDGVPVRLVDTAGIRAAHDEVEQLGIERSWQAAADADLVLLLLDGAAPLTTEDFDLLDRLQALPALTVAINKSDLPASWLEAQLTSLPARLPAPPLRVSATTGAGVPDLRGALRQLLLPAGEAAESELITNARHGQHLRQAQDSLGQAQESLRAGMPHEAILVDLYAALGQLDALTGQTTVEDILGLIFSTFCIGK